MGKQSDEVIGTLTVTVVCGMHLRVNEKTKTCSPLCALSVDDIDKKDVKTLTVKKSCNPVWDEVFHFRISTVDQVLRVKVFDQSLFRDHLLGKVELSIFPDFQDGVQIEELYAIEKKDQGRSGLLRLAIHFEWATEVLRQSLRPVDVSLGENCKILCHPSFKVVQVLSEWKDPTEMAEAAKGLVRVWESQRVTILFLEEAVRLEIERLAKEKYAAGLFRVDGFATKALACYLQLVAGDYVSYVLEELVNEVCTTDCGFEIDVSRATNMDNIDVNKRNLEAACQRAVDAIFRSSSMIPLGVRYIAVRLNALAEASLDVKENEALSGLFFLRFLCIAIMSPERYYLVEQAPSLNARRALILIAKVIQNLANGVSFGMKEAYMRPMNTFITQNRRRMNQFFADLKEPQVNLERAARLDSRPLRASEIIDAIQYLKSLLPRSVWGLEVEPLTPIPEEEVFLSESEDEGFDEDEIRSDEDERRSEEDRYRYSEEEDRYSVESWERDEDGSGDEGSFVRVLGERKSALSSPAALVPSASMRELDPDGDRRVEQRVAEKALLREREEEEFDREEEEEELRREEEERKLRDEEEMKMRMLEEEERMRELVEERIREEEERQREREREAAEAEERARLEEARLVAEAEERDRQLRELEELERLEELQKEQDRRDQEVREREEAARLEAEKQAREMEEQKTREREEAGRLEAERREEERKARKEEKERKEREREEAGRLEAERREEERKARKEEKERKEREREEAGRLDAEKKEKHLKEEKARKEREREEAGRLDAEKKEKHLKEEKARKEREREEAERARAEKEKHLKEEKARKEREREEAERARAEKEKHLKEEKARKEREREEAEQKKNREEVERKKREREEVERKAAEEEEAEKLAAEKAAEEREEAKRAAVEKEREEKENRERERRESEKVEEVAREGLTAAADATPKKRVSEIRRGGRARGGSAARGRGAGAKSPARPSSGTPTAVVPPKRALSLIKKFQRQVDEVETEKLRAARKIDPLEKHRLERSTAKPVTSSSSGSFVTTTRSDAESSGLRRATIATVGTSTIDARSESESAERKVVRPRQKVQVHRMKIKEIVAPPETSSTSKPPESVDQRCTMCSCTKFEEHVWIRGKCRNCRHMGSVHR